MTTKEQERKALAQIKKIIADLGEDSYIAIAMEGMIEDAEENIECDFAMSWKNRAEVAEARMSDLQTTYNKQMLDASNKISTLQYDLDFARINKEEEIDRLKAQIDDLTSSIKTRDGWVEQKNARIEELNKQLKEAADQVCDKIGEVAELLEKIECQKSEIIRLKAKLYDMMTKEEN